MLRAPRLNVRAQAAATPAMGAGVAVSVPRGKSLVKLLTGSDAAATKRTLQEPTGPKFLLPLVGETPEMLEKGQLKFGLERLLKYGPLFRTSVLGMDVVVVADPDLYKAMMVEDSKLVNFEIKGSFAKLQTDFNIKVLGNVDGARMPFRRIMLPAVTNEAMAGYVPKMDEIAKVLVKEWSQVADFDMAEGARKAAMRFANSLLAGIEVESEEDEAQLRTLMGVYFDGMISYDIDLPGTPLRKALNARDVLMKRVGKAVEAQLAQLLKEKQPTVPGQKVRKNLLGYVIDGQRAEGIEPTIKDITELALGVLQAGTDTSSAGLSGLMGVLSQRPDIIQRLRAEQAEAVKQHGWEINKAYLDSCKVLDASVREAMRFMPPAAFQYRVALKDFALGNYFIKQGTFLLVNTAVCQALESEPNWIVKAKMARAEGKPMPIPVGADFTRIGEGFNPDRWLTSDPKERPSMFTFSHGPHTCLGIAIFVQEAKVLLAHMIREYDMQLTSPALTWVEMPMVKPTPGLRMSLRRLEKPLVTPA